MAAIPYAEIFIPRSKKLKKIRPNSYNFNNLTIDADFITLNGSVIPKSNIRELTGYPNYYCLNNPAELGTMMCISTQNPIANIRQGNSIESIERALIYSLNRDVREITLDQEGMLKLLLVNICEQNENDELNTLFDFLKLKQDTKIFSSVLTICFCKLNFIILSNNYPGALQFIRFINTFEISPEIVDFDGNNAYYIAALAFLKYFCDNIETDIAMLPDDDNATSICITYHNVSSVRELLQKIRR